MPDEADRFAMQIEREAERGSRPYTASPSITRSPSAKASSDGPLPNPASLEAIENPPPTQRIQKERQSDSDMVNPSVASDSPNESTVVDPPPATSSIEGVETPAPLQDITKDDEVKDPSSKDAFILFNDRESAVPGIVRQLQMLGVTVYSFRKDLQYGEVWNEREENELKSCRCVLLFLGEKGWGPNHLRFTKEVQNRKDAKIIPVLLPNVPDEALDQAGGIFRELRRFELIPTTRSLIRELADQIRGSKGQAVSNNVKTGNAASIFREAESKHAVLDANQYADVLASLIQSVENKDALSFAILGPWGRGKTFLMRLVDDRLAKQSYTTVLFSAWKYRTTPELWSYLYETFYLQAAKSGWAVPVRTGLLRHGIWPIVPLLLTIAISLSTISQKAYLARFVLSLFGVLGVVYLLSVSRTFLKAGQSIKATYWDLPRHQERLGLQFAIGDDLRALLMGWMPNAAGWKVAWNTVFIKKPLSTLCYSIAAIAVWWTATEAATEKASGNLLVGLSVVVFLGIAQAVILLPLWALVRKNDNTNRILLVVDDLDRCHPEQMLEIIECLQLFLDDEDVKRRLKVVMLIEEDILRNALRRKYVDSLNIPENDRKRIDHLVNDNLEKLFLVWLRLEPLREDEIRAVFESVCGSLSPIKPAAGGDAAGDEAAGDEAADIEFTARDVDDAVGTTVIPAAASETEPIPGATEEQIDTPLSSEEETVIVSMVDQILYDTNRDRWSPRSVRSFVFRYQLARMLLVKLGKTYATADIVRAIATASDREVTAPGRDMDELLFRVARQVS